MQNLGSGMIFVDADGRGQAMLAYQGRLTIQWFGEQRYGVTWHAERIASRGGIDFGAAGLRDFAIGMDPSKLAHLRNTIRLKGSVTLEATRVEANQQRRGTLSDAPRHCWIVVAQAPRPRLARYC